MSILNSILFIFGICAVATIIVMINLDHVLAVIQFFKDFYKIIKERFSK